MKKIDNSINIEINNGGTLRLSQTEADKLRRGVALESITANGEVYRRDLIDEGDLIMLMNYYRYIKDHDIKDEFINRDGLTEKYEYNVGCEDAIKYYEERLKPIFEVSKNYGVDFNSRIPFEEFGSDDDNYIMFSFSDFYRELLDKFNTKIGDIRTEDVSDGKYKMVIEESIALDIRAWDDLSSVIDTCNTLIEYSKHKDLER